MPVRPLPPPFIAVQAIVLLMLLPPVAAQPGGPGARAAALAAATTALEGDPWGRVNPAGWAGVGPLTLAVSAGRPFGLDALREAAAVIVMPVRRTRVAFAAAAFGDAAYAEHEWAVGAARAVFPGTHRPVFLGVRFSLHTAWPAGYARAAAWSIGAGWQVAPAHGLRVGMAASALNGPAWGEGARMPRTLGAGIAYAAAPGVDVLLALERSSRHPMSVRSGIEWRPAPPLSLRAGAATAPQRWTAGFGLRLGAATISSAVERHHVLGWSPTLALLVQPRRTR